MVSKAIASLDAWLARAEEVLREQREHCLSPSLVSLPDSTQDHTIITLDTLRKGQHAQQLCVQILSRALGPYSFWRVRTTSLVLRSQ